MMVVIKVAKNVKVHAILVNLTQVIAQIANQHKIDKSIYKIINVYAKLDILNY